MKSIFIKVSLLILIFSANVVYAKYVVIGHTKSSDAKATAEVIKQVFERKGFNVATKSGPAELMFDMLVDKEIDFLVGGWLSTTHKTYWEKNKENLIKIGIIYEKAGYHLAVPSYISREHVETISDLLKQNVKDRINNNIAVSKTDAEMLYQSASTLNKYSLDKDGFLINSLSQTELMEFITSNSKEEKWFVLGLRRPSYLTKLTSLRILHDPKSIYVGNADVHLIANQKSWNYIKKPMQEVLKKIELSVKSIEELDYAINVRKMSVHDAARRWLGSRPYTVEYWLEPDLD